MPKPSPQISTWTENPQRDPRWVCESVASNVRDFHVRLPGYAPTKLVDLPDLADEFEVRHVFAKEESNRLGLPAFKALGASWAIHRALEDHFGSTSSPEQATIVTATDGNHGRAVAHFARQFGQRAEVFVPEWVSTEAIQAIRDEGAMVTLVRGSHDDAVGAAARHAEKASQDGGVRLLVQDMAWDGYEDVPGWIVDGYSTLFQEIDDQLADREASRPDLVVVPTGVGSLLQAAIAHYRSDPARLSTAIMSVEPAGAACVLASVRAEERVSVDTSETIMAGLNCGSVSTLAWPYIVHGLDACVAVADSVAITAAHDLTASGVDAGPCGAASLAGVRVLHVAAGQGVVERRRSVLGLSADATIVLLDTEGVEANPSLDSSGHP